MTTTVTVKGTSYEQGVQQGQALRDSIARNVASVHAKLKDTHCDMVRYQAFVNQNVEFMKREQPHLYEEMEGIAVGSGISLDDILILNIPAYFMTDYFNQECSMVLARGKATADGCTYVIKNRDMGMPMEQRVIHRLYPDGLELVEVNSSGTVTYPASGMNNYGLGVTTTGFWSKKAPSDVDKANAAHIFLNVHLLLKNCKSAKEVLEYVKTSPRMNGLNVIAVDRTDAYVIEMTKDDMYVEADNGSGILYRSNHYRSDKFSHLNPDPDAYTSTYKRSERMNQILEERYGRIRFQDMIRIMSDHENGINSICRHPHGDVKAQTVSSSMFVLEDFEAWTLLGNPCEQLSHVALQSRK